MINIFDNKKNFLAGSFLMFVLFLFISFGDIKTAFGGGQCGNCFVAGTEITMFDNTIKKIEDVKIGDQVKTMNTETMKIENNLVEEIASPVHSDMVRLTFQGGENKNTFDHPYYVKGKGFSSYKPALTQQRYGFSVAFLEVGDTVYRLDNKNKLIEEKLLNITEEIKEVQTYNLNRVSNNHNFFAGGYLVHNKGEGSGSCFTAGTKVTMSDGTLKNIEDVEIGERVLGKNNKINQVTGLERPIVGSRKTYIINNKVEATGDHPFWTTEGWKVNDLEYKLEILKNSNKVYQGENPINEDTISQLKVGDILFTKNGQEKIEKIEVRTDRPFAETVYDLNLDGDHTYFANDFSVHNCGREEPYTCDSYDEGLLSACSATACGTTGTRSQTIESCSIQHVGGADANDECVCHTETEQTDCSAPACPDPVPPSPPTISGSCSTKNKINVSWNNPGEGTTHYQFRISEAGAPDSEVNIIKK